MSGVPQRPSRPLAWLRASSYCSLSRAATRDEVWPERRVDVPRAGAHDQPLHGRQPHGRVDAAATAHGADAGPVAEVQEDQVGLRERLAQQLGSATRDKGEGDPVEAIATNPVALAPGTWHGVGVRARREAPVKGGVEDGDVRYVGKATCRGRGDPGQAAREVQRAPAGSRPRCREMTVSSTSTGPWKCGPTMNDPMPDGDQRTGACSEHLVDPARRAPGDAAVSGRRASAARCAPDEPSTHDVVRSRGPAPRSAATRSPHSARAPAGSPVAALATSSRRRRAGRPGSRGCSARGRRAASSHRRARSSQPVTRRWARRRASLARWKRLIRFSTTMSNGRRGRALLVEPADVEATRVAAPVDQLVDRARVAVEREHDMPVAR